MGRPLAYAAIFLFWGASFLAIREIVQIAPPFLSAGFRFTVAGLILIAAAIAQRAPGPSWQELRSVAWLGLIFFAIDYSCVFWAEQRVASGFAAIVSATIPVWVFAGEWLWLKSIKPAPSSFAGLLFGITGVVLLVLPSTGPGGRAGEFVLFIGALAWTLGTLLSRKLTVPKSRFLSAGLQMFIGGALLFLMALAAGEFDRLPEVARVWTWRLSLDMAYLVVAASILAFLAYTWLISREPASRVSSYAYVNPLIAVTLGAVVAGERLAVEQFVGGALVLVGVVFTLRARNT